MESTNEERSISKKRAREAVASSDESEEEPQSRPGAPRQRGNTRPTTFKACNECRQQKLRCDVVGEPGQAHAPCTRCKKHSLQCKIDPNFKRVKKRGKYEELQREVEELRAKLAEKRQEVVSKVQLPYAIQNEVSLPKSGGSLPSMQRLEDTSLSGERVAHLYNEFFACYYPLLPLLDRQLGIDHYFTVSPLLGWTIMYIASRRSRYEPTLFAQLTAPYTKLLWTSISAMPQVYHIVKALCLLCTWPLTAANSSVDANFVLVGIMMQVALHSGLHRPAYARDFGRTITSISDAEIRDRTRTWCACNIVVQRATDSHPSRSIYDWTLGLNLADGNSLELPNDLLTQLKIEKFCDKVERTLFQNPLDPLGILPEMEQATTMSVLRMEYRELEASLSDNLTAINKFYFLAAGLHLHGFAFLIPRTSPAHSTELLNAYHAATSYIQAALEYEANTSSFFRYCSSPLQQALTSACCILLKLLNSSFAVHLDLCQGKTLYNSGVLALRSMSINANDLPARTAEALTRMWRAAGAGEGSSNPVELKIRSRMSSSHVFDCMWSWKEGIGASVQQTTRPAMSQVIGNSSQPGTGDFQPVFDDFNGLSALQDFDLFNTLDWVLDGNALAWPGGQSFPPLP